MGTNRVWEMLVHVALPVGNSPLHGGGCEGITPQNARRYLGMVEIIPSEVRKRLFCMNFSSSLVKDDSIQ